MMKLLFTDDWLRRKLAAGPDVELQAGRITANETAYLAESRQQSFRPDLRFGVAERGKPTDEELRREREINAEPSEPIEGGVRKLPIRYE